MLGWKPSKLLSIKALRQRCLPLGVVLSLIYWDPGPSPVGEMMMTVGGVRGASETPISVSPAPATPLGVKSRYLAALY